MARSNREIRDRLDEIDEILETGVSSVSVDGTSTTFDLAALRRERQTLRQKLPEYRARRPRASRINLGGF